MCDTMVALGNSTIDGRVLFAKNSNREPNECHVMIRVSRKQYKNSTKVQCTYIPIDQAEETYEVLLLKPFWIWGAEMGCNEYGLNIGNEAVFTKEPYGKDSLTGMDMLRIALERCKTALEALDYIVRLLELYGQGGNCGYQKNFTYHNSFLIADRDSAWVLETAGIYWAAIKVKDIYSISNRLSIGSHYDLSHPGLVKHAIEKGWCKGENDFDFSKCYSNPLITKLSAAKERQAISSNCLRMEKGNINAETMMRILRSHHPAYEKKPFRKSSLASVCCHGGFIYGDHTTGSYIASLDKDQDMYWITGSSTPCLSVFKPLWLIEQEPITFREDQMEDAIAYWKTRETFHRCVLENRILNLNDYHTERNKLENTLLSKAAEITSLSDIESQQRRSLMVFAQTEERALLERFLPKTNANPRIAGNPYYRYYWKKMNRQLHSKT